MRKNKTKKEQPIKTVDSLQGGGLIKEKVQSWKDSFLLRGAVRDKDKKEDETKY